MVSLTSSIVSSTFLIPGIVVGVVYSSIFSLKVSSSSKLIVIIFTVTTVSSPIIFYISVTISSISSLVYGFSLLWSMKTVIIVTLSFTASV